MIRFRKVIEKPWWSFIGVILFIIWEILKIVPSIKETPFLKNENVIFVISVFQWLLVGTALSIAVNSYRIARRKTLKTELILFQNYFNNHGWVGFRGGQVINYTDIFYSLNSSLAKLDGMDPQGAEKVLRKRLERNIIFSGWIFRPSNYNNNASADRLALEDDSNSGYGFYVSHGTNSAGIEIRKNGNPCDPISLQERFFAPKNQWYHFVFSVMENGIVRLELYDEEFKKILSLVGKNGE